VSAPITCPGQWVLIDEINGLSIAVGDVRRDPLGTPLTIVAGVPPRYDRYGRVETDRGVYNPLVLGLRWECVATR